MLIMMGCICAHRVLKIERSGAVHLPPIYHSDNQTKLHARDVEPRHNIQLTFFYRTSAATYKRVLYGLHNLSR
jgi:hypothetical protein